MIPTYHDLEQKITKCVDLLYREFLLVTLTTQTAQNYKSMKFGIDTSVLFFVLLHTIGISDIVVANAAVFFSVANKHQKSAARRARRRRVDNIDD